MRELNTKEISNISGGIAPVTGLVGGGILGAIMGVGLLVEQTGTGYGGNIALALLAPTVGTIGAFAGATVGYIYAINRP